MSEFVAGFCLAVFFGLVLLGLYNSTTKSQMLSNRTGMECVCTEGK